MKSSIFNNHSHFKNILHARQNLPEEQMGSVGCQPLSSESKLESNLMRIWILFSCKVGEQPLVSRNDHLVSKILKDLF